jgi:hypothetical protein
MGYQNQGSCPTFVERTPGRRDFSALKSSKFNHFGSQRRFSRCPEEPGKTRRCNEIGSRPEIEGVRGIINQIEVLVPSRRNDLRPFSPGVSIGQDRASPGEMYVVA